jgi:hypothetical protein
MGREIRLFELPAGSEELRVFGTTETSRAMDDAGRIHQILKAYRKYVNQAQRQALYVTNINRVPRKLSIFSESRTPGDLWSRLMGRGS